jgi:hypothetical protein
MVAEDDHNTGYKLRLVSIVVEIQVTTMQRGRKESENCGLIHR